METLIQENQVAVDYLRKTSQHVFELKHSEKHSTITKLVSIKRKDGTLHYYNVALNFDRETNTVKLKCINDLSAYTEKQKHHSHLGSEKHFVDVIVSQELFNTFKKEKYQAIKSGWKVNSGAWNHLSLNEVFYEVKKWIQKDYEKFIEHAVKQKWNWFFRVRVNLDELIKDLEKETYTKKYFGVEI